MARETHRGNRYKPGDYWRECDVCGFDYLRSKLVKRWDNAIVCKKDNDPRPRSMKPKSKPKESSFRRD